MCSHNHRSRRVYLTSNTYPKETAIETRKLGNNNLEVSALGLGCMGMSWSYGAAKDKQEMITLI